MIRYIQSLIAVIFFTVSMASHSANSKPIIIGMDADMSKAAVQGGIAIQRGAELAIDEINRIGGVLGRPLKLIVKDHRGNPARGVGNIKAFAAMDDVVAVLGGVHTPVAMHELPTLHANKMIYLGLWAAGTPVVDNGFEPNYVFRVSVRDQFAGAFLIEKALKRGFTRIALALEKTGWGRSNEKAMKAALFNAGLTPVETAWFHWGAKNMDKAVNQLLKSKPDVMLLVANAPEGLSIVRAMATQPTANRIPIISHWGITGGDFYALSKGSLDQVDLSFLQTYSFINPRYPERSEKLVKAYIERYSDVSSAKGIFAPTGTAHAYDIIHMLAKAITKAGTIERSKVQIAMENLGNYQGLLRDYRPPFNATRHDALDSSDFNLSKYDENGVIQPLK